MTRPRFIPPSPFFVRLLTWLTLAGVIGITVQPWQITWARSMQQATPSTTQAPTDDSPDLTNWWNQDINASDAPQAPPGATVAQPSAFMQRQASDQERKFQKQQLELPTPVAQPLHLSPTPVATRNPTAGTSGTGAPGSLSPEHPSQTQSGNPQAAQPAGENSHRHQRETTQSAPRWMQESPVQAGKSVKQAKSKPLVPAQTTNTEPDQQARPSKQALNQQRAQAKAAQRAAEQQARLAQMLKRQQELREKEAQEEAARAKRLQEKALQQKQAAEQQSQEKAEQERRFAEKKAEEKAAQDKRAADIKAQEQALLAKKAQQKVELARRLGEKKALKQALRDKKARAEAQKKAEQAKRLEERKAQEQTLTEQQAQENAELTKRAEAKMAQEKAQLEVRAAEKQAREKAFREKRAQLTAQRDTEAHDQKAQQKLAREKHSEERIARAKAQEKAEKEEKEARTQAAQQKHLAEKQAHEAAIKAKKTQLEVLRQQALQNEALKEKRVADQKAQATAEQAQRVEAKKAQKEALKARKAQEKAEKAQKQLEERNAHEAAEQAKAAQTLAEQVKRAEARRNLEKALAEKKAQAKAEQARRAEARKAQEAALQEAKLKKKREQEKAVSRKAQQAATMTPSANEAVAPPMNTQPERRVKHQKASKKQLETRQAPGMAPDSTAPKTASNSSQAQPAEAPAVNSSSTADAKPTAPQASPMDRTFNTNVPTFSTPASPTVPLHLVPQQEAVQEAPTAAPENNTAAPSAADVTLPASGEPEATDASKDAAMPLAQVQHQVDLYANMLADWMKSTKQQSFEPVLNQGQVAASAILRSVDALDEDTFNALRQKMQGYLLLRDNVIVAAPDPNFFIAPMKKHGRAADVAFFELMSQTVNGYWPTTMEQRSDLSGCSRFGTGDLVKLYGAWQNFEKHYPGAYQAALHDPNLPLLSDIEDQLLNSHAACDGPNSVVDELKLFVDSYPNSKLTPKIKKRLQSLQRSQFDMTFYQGVKYNADR